MARALFHRSPCPASGSAGLTTAFVTHDQDEGMAMADLVVVMGRIEPVGRPQDIRVRRAIGFGREFATA